MILILLALQSLFTTFNDETLGRVKKHFKSFQNNCLRVFNNTKDNKGKASVYFILKATYDAIIKALRQRVYVQEVIEKVKQENVLQKQGVKIASSLFDDCDHVTQ